ncbi:MAG: hypothetical protein VZS44_08655 [Bacilli bacterium]|nr:hypothetical protein [Bacilli bacterium]
MSTVKKATCTNIKQIIVALSQLQKQDRVEYYYSIFYSSGNIKTWYSDKQGYGYLLNPHLVVFKDITASNSCIQIQAIYRGEVFYNSFLESFGDLFIIS